jgi:acyl carrier protein
LRLSESKGNASLCSPRGAAFIIGYFASPTAASFRNLRTYHIFALCLETVPAPLLARAIVGLLDLGGSPDRRKEVKKTPQTRGHVRPNTGCIRRPTKPAWDESKEGVFLAHCGDVALRGRGNLGAWGCGEMIGEPSPSAEACDGMLGVFFRDFFDDDTLKLRPEMTARDIDGWDSLAHVRLLLAIGRKYHIRFSTPEVGALQSVGDLVSLVAHKTNSK